MGQVILGTEPATRRSFRHALRPLLILGGFAAVWWILMTGAAQADSGPQHQARQHHDLLQTVRSTTEQAHHVVDTTVSRHPAPARRHAHPVAHTVKSAVRSTPVAPALKQTVGTVRATVHSTVATTVQTTRSVLRDTVKTPLVHTVDAAVEQHLASAESSTLQGEPASQGHHQRTRVNPGSAASSATVLSVVDVAPHTLTSRTPASVSTDAGLPLRPGGSPSPATHGPGAQSSGPSSTPYVPVGVTESTLLVTPMVLRDHHVWRLARLPEGPAYEPGSSPD